MHGVRWLAVTGRVAIVLVAFGFVGAGCGAAANAPVDTVRAADTQAPDVTNGENSRRQRPATADDGVPAAIALEMETACQGFAGPQFEEPRSELTKKLCDGVVHVFGELRAKGIATPSSTAPPEFSKASLAGKYEQVSWSCGDDSEERVTAAVPRGDPDDASPGIALVRQRYWRRDADGKNDRTEWCTAEIDVRNYPGTLDLYHRLAWLSQKVAQAEKPR